MPFAETRDGTRLHYQDWGTGRPVVLLSSAMQNSRMWEHLSAGLLGAGLRCVTYDRRGHGRSDWPWDGYDYDTLADDLAGLLDHLDLRDVTLVGYAMGGGEAVRYVSRHGTDRIRSIALVSSVTPFMMRTDDNPEGLDPAVFDTMAESLTADRPQWMEDAAVPFFAGPDGHPDRLPVSPGLARWIGDMALDSSPRAALEVSRSLFTTDFRADLEGLTVPVLIVHGAQDMGAPLEVCGLRTARALPGSRFVVYEDAAHGLFATHPERLEEDLLAFMGVTDGGAPGQAGRPPARANV